MASPHLSEFGTEMIRRFGRPGSRGLTGGIAHHLADPREVQTLDIAEVLDAFENFEELSTVESKMTIAPGGRHETNVLPQAQRRGAHSNDPGGLPDREQADAARLRCTLLHLHPPMGGDHEKGSIAELLRMLSALRQCRALSRVRRDKVGPIRLTRLFSLCNLLGTSAAFGRTRNP